MTPTWKSDKIIDNFVKTFVYIFFYFYSDVISVLSLQHHALIKISFYSVEKQTHREEITSKMTLVKFFLPRTYKQNENKRLNIKGYEFKANNDESENILARNTLLESNRDVERRLDILREIKYKILKLTYAKE